MCIIVPNPFIECHPEPINRVTHISAPKQVLKELTAKTFSNLKRKTPNSSLHQARGGVFHLRGGRGGGKLMEK